jgi:hypothetical protein
MLRYDKIAFREELPVTLEAYAERMQEYFCLLKLMMTVKTVLYLEKLN